MPELPEVETIRRDLEKQILSKVFHTIQVIDLLVLRTSQKTFISGLKAQKIVAAIRRGKALLLELSNKKYLLVQLMMTGQLITEGKADKHTRVIFKFTDGSNLLYNDQRRFGQLRLINSFSESKHLNALGPEPFAEDFSPTHIFDKTRESKRPIKNLLLDHTFVAGIGNIYACEILFRSKISPTRLSGKISPKEAQEIYKQTKLVLQEAINNRGSSMRNYRDASGQEGQFKKLIQVYAREGKSCLECKKPIKRIVQAGRSTFYCSKCQR